MRQATLGSVGAEGLPSEPPPSPPTDGLHLGTTAGSVVNDSMDSTATVAQVWIGVGSSAAQMTAVLFCRQSGPVSDLLPPHTLALYLPSNSQLPWQPASLETVIEETGSELYSSRPQSQLSARQSPRLNSPRVSIDHTPTQVHTPVLHVILLQTYHCVSACRMFLWLWRETCQQACWGQG